MVESPSVPYQSGDTADTTNEQQAWAASVSQPSESQTISDQVTSSTSATPQIYSGGSGGGGSDFSVQQGVGIATALIPLVSLFKGSGHKKTKSKPVVRRPIQRTAPATPGMSQNTKLLLLGGGAVVILGLGIVLMSRK